MKIDVDRLINIEGIGEKTIQRIKDELREEIAQQQVDELRPAPKLYLKPNTIYCGRAEDVLRGFPEGRVDLTVTSPPYGNLRTYEGFDFNFELMARELYRVTKPGGVVVWVVGDEVVNGSESGESFRQALYFKEIGFRLHDTMIYRKTGFAHPASIRYHQIFEYMFVFSKGQPKTFNPIKDREVKWGTAWGKNTYRTKEGELVEARKREDYEELGMRFNIWKIRSSGGFGQSDEIAYEHPATFPEGLAKGHIRSWSNEGDLVLDPMCGSGTTLKMAEELDREWVGIDVSEKYCRLARRRIDGDE